ncbi:MAG: S8 family serine peptidase [Trueperaceae bacterium]|nr:S8 family serine peptidase [Trueperaceae bacterium]
MHPRHTRLRRALLLASLAMLLVTGCDVFRPARLTVTPATAYVDLSAGPRSAVFAVRNDGPSRSRLTWTFASPGLLAYPASGTLAGGAEQDVVVALPASAGVGTFTGDFTAGDTSVPIIVVTYMGLACEPEAAFAATASAADEILVGYRSGVGGDGIARASASDAATAIVVAAGGTVVRRGLGSEHDLVRAPPGGRDALLAALLRRPEVAYAVPNAPISRAAAPDDPLYGRQWNLSAFGAEQAWAVVDVATSAAAVVVAVIDDGVAVDHPDLAGALLPGWDVFDGDADVRNCTDHGTHVTGIVAAVRGDAVGVAGAASAPWVRVLPVKAWPNSADPQATTLLDPVLRSMRWAGGLDVAGLPINPNPAHVINMSLGVAGSGFSTSFAPVIDELEARGIVVVAAAGNAGAGALDQPAGSATIAVGSVDAGYLRSNFSNYGPGLTLMAPGGYGPPGATCPAITSTGIDYFAGSATHTWTCKAGTSMATPYVASAAALLMGLEEGLRGDPVAVATRLASAAEQLRPLGYTSDRYGAGVLCLDALLTTTSVCGVPLAP